MTIPLARGARPVLGLIPVAALAALAGLAVTGSAGVVGLADPGAWVRWAGPVLSAVNHLAAAIVLGGLVLMLVVLPYAKGRAPSWQRAAKVLLWVAPAWALLNVADVLVRYARAAGRPLGGPGFEEELAYFLTEISPGRASLVATVLIALAAVGAVGITSYRSAALTAVPAFAVLLPWSVRGHASSAADHTVAVSAMWLHLLAVAVWVGGLVVLCLLSTTLGEHLAAVVRRYSAVALGCFLLVGISGVVNGSTRLDQPADLTGPYGRLVLAKIVLFTALGIVGWWHRRRTVGALQGPGARPAAFWRLAGGEVLVMAATTGVAAALAVTQTPVPEAYLPAPAEELSGRPLPPPPQVSTWLQYVNPDVVFAVVVAAAAVLYLAGVRRQHRAGRSWPWWRTAAFLGAVAVLGWTVLGGPAVYGTLMFSAHAVAVVLLIGVVAPGIVAGAPRTLATAVLSARPDDSRGPREWLQVLAGAAPVRYLSRPVPAAVHLAVGPVVLHGSGLFELALTTQVGRGLMVVYLVTLGMLLTRAVTARTRYPRRERLAAGLVTVLAVALLGTALRLRTALLAADYFGALGLPWGVDALADQRAGAWVAWCGGGLFAVALTAAGALRGTPDGEAGPGASSRRPQADDDGMEAELRAYERMLERMDRRASRG